MTTSNSFSTSYRDYAAPLGAQLMREPRLIPRILLVDDDPTYARIFQRIAANHKVPITVCTSLDDIGALGNLNFDVAIIDYDLGAVTGVELTTYLERNFPTNLPVILISQTRQLISRRWPDSIKDFVHKALGPYAVLEAAFDAFEVERIHREINTKQAGKGMIH